MVWKLSEKGILVTWYNILSLIVSVESKVIKLFLLDYAATGFRAGKKSSSVVSESRVDDSC